MSKAAGIIEQIKNNSIIKLILHELIWEEEISNIIFKEIFKTLKSNISVKAIDLNHCRINDAKAIIIAEALEINKNIKKIELDRNYKITSIGVAAIINAPKDSQITVFSYCNYYNHVHLKFFVKIFENCNLLQTLKLNGAKIDKVTAKIFAEAISQHKSIQFIDINYCIQKIDSTLILLNGIEQSRSLGWACISNYGNKSENKLINDRICEILKNNRLFIYNDIDCLVAKYNYRNITWTPKELWLYILSFLGKDNLWAVKTIQNSEINQFNKVTSEDFKYSSPQENLNNSELLCMTGDMTD